jgi:hypothetical protein
VIEGELDRDGQPSCSAAEALERQEPFVNPILANHALALLARVVSIRHDQLSRSIRKPILPWFRAGLTCRSVVLAASAPEAGFREISPHDSGIIADYCSAAIFAPLGLISS